MMALSLINITTTSPAAPPGVAPVVSAFDLLLPVADPADPRHEHAPDGKQIGKDMPVDPAAAPNPLAWLTPRVGPPIGAPLSQQLPTQVGGGDPVVPDVSTSLPAVTIVAPPTTSTAAPSYPLTPSEQPLATATIERPAPRSLPALAGEAPTALSPPVLPAPSSPTGTPPELVATTQPPRVAIAPPMSSGATSTGATRDLPAPAGRAGPSVTPEIRPASTPSLTTPRIAPAAQVFADAIHRAVRDDNGPATPDAAGFTAVSEIKAHAVAATADAQHGALDLRQEHWPARMIERIDALRDAANANDTSIRLIPDALGKIDVSLKRDGDTVTVNFIAQQAETRQLLADAAPKLTELAEARGLKLAQNGAETAGQRQQRQQPTAQLAPAPRSARAEETESTDTRIA